jgi:hypothetical protein
MKELTTTKLEHVHGGAFFIAPAVVYVAKGVAMGVAGGAIAGATAALIKHWIE